MTSGFHAYMCPAVKPVKPKVPDENTIKVAITAKIVGKELVPAFKALNKQQPLQLFLSELLEEWGLDDLTKWALKFVAADGRDYFLTEENRKDLKAKKCEEILQYLSMKEEIVDREAQKSALEQLKDLAMDLAFVTEFMNQNGFQVLCEQMENESVVTGLALDYLLECFGRIMDHGLISWDVLSDRLVHQVAKQVSGEARLEKTSTIKEALEILESMIVNSTAKLQVMTNYVNVDGLVRHLDSSDAAVQLNALSLMNVMFSKAVDTARKSVSLTMSGGAFRSSLCNSVLCRPLGDDMAHQLHVLQHLQLNMHAEAMHTKLKLQSLDSIEMDKLLELRRRALSVCAEQPLSPTAHRKFIDAKSRDYKKLGFRNYQNPIDDLQECPPGSLALDCMVYFARHYSETYASLVLENSCRTDHHECPFAQTSIALTKVLIELLKIGEPPSDSGKAFIPMFFKHSNPLYDTFCICIRLLNKTWSEMQATIDDLPKVLSVVNDQIRLSLLENPPDTFEKFQEQLQSYNYAKIQIIREQQRSLREESEFQAQPIVELRERLMPEMIGLVRLNRLNCLAEGKVFAKYSTGTDSHVTREKGKFWFWQLSDNHKVFHYGECNEQKPPRFEDCKGRLPITDLKDCVVGRDCGFIKEGKRNKANAALAFSIYIESPEECFNFVAPDEETFALWTDGLNALLNRPMISKESQKDIDTLLRMELKIQLMETIGIRIPNEAPPIPPFPANLDFCYEYLN